MAQRQSQQNRSIMFVTLGDGRWRYSIPGCQNHPFTETTCGIAARASTCTFQKTAIWPAPSPLAFTPMDGGLIFDLGMNDGSDTAFYLAKGFSVVGVDAAEDLCGPVRDKYQAEIDAGRLAIENVAVTESEGPVTFYPNEKSVWGTTRQRLGRAQRQACRTAPPPPSPSGRAAVVSARQVRHPVLPEDRHRRRRPRRAQRAAGASAKCRRSCRSSPTRCPGTRWSRNSTR